MSRRSKHRRRRRRARLRAQFVEFVHAFAVEPHRAPASRLAIRLATVVQSWRGTGLFRAGHPSFAS